MENKRDNYIDILKAWGILLVIYNHSGPFAYANIVSRFHIPLFFLLSGITVCKAIIDEQNVSLYSFIIKKIKSLIIPYYIFGIIDLVVYLIVSPELFSKKQILAYILGMRGIEEYYFTGALWFLTALFSVEIVLFIICRFVRNELNQIAILILICCFQRAKLKYNIVLPFNLDVLPLVIPFTYMGYQLKKKGLYERYKDSNCGWMKFIISVVILCYLSYFDGTIDVFAKSYRDYFSYLAAALAGCYFSGEVFKKLVNFKLTFINKVLSFIGVNSLYYMAIHQQIVGHPLNCIGFRIDNSLLNNMALFSINLVVSIILAPLYKKILEVCHLR